MDGMIFELKNKSTRHSPSFRNKLTLLPLKTLAHANCTLFCAPNAQKRTGSQQGKKTFSLDV